MYVNSTRPFLKREDAKLSLSLINIRIMSRSREAISKDEMEAAGPSKRRKISETPVPKRATLTPTFEFPSAPGSLSLKQCYSRLGRALRYRQSEEESGPDNGDLVVCRMLKEVWTSASRLDEHLHFLPATAPASLQAPLFLVKIAYIQAAALHNLAQFADMVHEVEIVLKPQHRCDTAFVTKERRINVDQTEDHQDFLRAAMYYYEAADSQFKLFQQQHPRASNLECWELLILSGRVQCLCEIYEQSQEFECDELEYEARQSTKTFTESISEFVKALPELIKNLPVVDSYQAGSLLNYPTAGNYYGLFLSLNSTISYITRIVTANFYCEEDKEHCYPLALFSSLEAILEQPSVRFCKGEKLSTLGEVMLARFKIAQDEVEENHRHIDEEDYEECYGSDFEEDEYEDKIIELPDVEEVQNVRELGKKGENLHLRNIFSEKSSSSFI